ncbi:MAG: DNA internalization-related competence protein ComEC/Rec2 [Candidatus Margulisiibacteriota bacterium]|jgi:competence protein ComEC
MLTKRPLVFFTMLFLLGLVFGKQYLAVPPVAPSGLVQLTGIIISDPSQGEKVSKFIISDYKYGAVSVVYLANEPLLRYGDRVRLEGILQNESSYKNPGISSFSDYLTTRKIFFQGIVGSGDLMIVARNRGNPLKRLAISLKSKLVAIHQQTLPAPCDSLLNSIIFGNQATPLPEGLQQEYKKAGIIHLLVVSGSQVALLIGSCLWLCRLLRFSVLNTFLTASIFNLLFLLITGAEPSITRASIMAEIALIGRSLGRDNDVYTTMAAAALVLAVFNPQILLNAGFQLSFAATWALVFGVPKLERSFSRKLPKWLAGPSALAVAPFLFTTPLTIFQFSGLSLVSLPFNFILIPWLELLVTLGFISTLAGLLWLPLAFFLNGANYFLLLVLQVLVHFFAGLPLSYIFLAAPPLVLVLLFYVWLLVFLENLQSNKYSAKLVSGTLLIILLAWGTSNFISAPRLLTITMIDVGQGDSILVETPRGKKILIDTGDKNAGKFAVLPVLQRKGINYLDLFIASHEHDDHIGGLPLLLGNIKPGKYLEATETPKEISAIIKRAKLPQFKVTEQMRYQLDPDTKILFLPPVQGAGDEANVNEKCLSIKVIYKHFSMLFTGDLDQAGEANLLNVMRQGPADLLRANILKVGHHGSKGSSSTDFLKAVAPQAALISCGRHNKFGHPHRDALQRLDQLHIPYYRTDRSGAITVKTDGERFFIKPYIAEHRPCK